MYRYLFFIAIILLISCQKKENGLFTIPVNTHDLVDIPLSTIAERIDKIELETTDESLISRIKQVLCNDEYIVIVGSKNIFLFNNQGDFISQIGRVGNGPGEFNYAGKVCVDWKNKKLYSTDYMQFICYNLNGEFVAEKKSIIKGKAKYAANVGESIYIVQEMWEQKATHSSLLVLDKDLETIKDSIDIRFVSLPNMMLTSSFYEDLMTIENGQIYLYFPELNPEKCMRDTLYVVKDHKLNPYLRLSFGDIYNMDGYKTIYLMNIYKSARYVFATFLTQDNQKECVQFCYDTQTQQGGCVRGYTDDIHSTGKVVLRPLHTDGEKFWFTKTIWDGEGDEPNPTLFIGTLKK